MELIYVNTSARSLMPEGWFGKRCFEVLPVAGETCAFHCPKIRAVNEAAEIVYCEESVCTWGNDCAVFGVGLIPLGPGSQERGRAVLVLRSKEGSRDESQFEAQLLDHARDVQKRIVASIVGAS